MSGPGPETARSGQSLMPLRLSRAILRQGAATLAGPIDLTVEGRGLSCIIGPNGAGKTSILKMLHGLAPLASGRLDWQGGAPGPRAGQGFVFQTPVMLRRSVAENLTYPLRLAGMDRTAARARAGIWLQKVGLAGMGEQPARGLSGGERQKLALARALIREPELLLLDEPCANLDGQATQAIEELLQEARAGGTRIVMTTHDLGQARRLADEVLFIYRGRIHERGPAPGFFSDCETPEAQAFLKGDIVK